MHKKHLVLFFVLLFLALSFGAASAQDGATINIAWPYQLPPDGHFNSYASGVINLGVYHDLMEPPFAVYMWAAGAYEGMAAESFGFDDDNNYVITLKSGVTWSDGTAVTAQDVVTSFYTGYLIGSPVWSYVASVEAVDEMTARFVMKSPSPLAEYRILTSQLRPTSVYGSFAEGAQPLVEAGAASGDADFDALLAELTDFRPEQYVSAGPFVLLSENISDASVVLVKNDGGLNADVVLFDRAVVWNGETEAVTPLVSNGDLWYATHGFPPATEAAFIEQGIDIIRGPGYSGPALYVNHSVAPLNRPEVRQAMAYAIDREQNGFVSLGESGIASECMCGFSDNLTPLWLSDATMDALNTYDYDTDMAAQVLEGIGFSLGDDGVWVDDQGNRMAFELIFPAEFLDWAAAAEKCHAAVERFRLRDHSAWCTVPAAAAGRVRQQLPDGDPQLGHRQSVPRPELPRTLQPL
jgi:peptide/nickel transport system substrate-binding protein